MKSPNFDGWFRIRQKEMMQKLEALQLEALCNEVGKHVFVFVSCFKNGLLAFSVSNAVITNSEDTLLDSVLYSSLLTSRRAHIGTAIQRAIVLHLYCKVLAHKFEQNFLLCRRLPSVTFWDDFHHLCSQFPFYFFKVCILKAILHLTPYFFNF